MPLPNVNVASVKLLPSSTYVPLIRTLLFANIELVMVPTSLDVINAPFVVGNVITLPFDVDMLDTFIVVPKIEPLLTIELPVIVPVAVTLLENIVCVIGTPLA
jgi:hypothetical protein